MHPVGLQVRTLDGVADDWPISYAELLPYYERVDARLRRRPGWRATRRTRPAREPPLPPLPISADGQAWRAG